MTTEKTPRLPEPAEGIISREFDGEYVIYDQSTDRAANLTGISARVWRALQGGPAPDLPPEDIDTAIEELGEFGFLRSPVSRRSVLGAALVGGAFVSLSGIETLIAPTAASAATANSITFSNAAVSHFLIVGGNTTVSYTLIGGGGGGGGGYGANFGNSGGNAGGLTGSFKTGSGSSFNFTVLVGAGGGGGGGEVTPAEAAAPVSPLAGLGETARLGTLVLVLVVVVAPRACIRPLWAWVPRSSSPLAAVAEVQVGAQARSGSVDPETRAVVELAALAPTALPAQLAPWARRGAAPEGSATASMAPAAAAAAAASPDRAVAPSTPPVDQVRAELAPPGVVAPLRGRAEAAAAASGAQAEAEAGTLGTREAEADQGAHSGTPWGRSLSFLALPLHRPGELVRMALSTMEAEAQGAPDTPRSRFRAGPSWGSPSPRRGRGFLRQAR